MAVRDVCMYVCSPTFHEYMLAELLNVHSFIDNANEVLHVKSSTFVRVY